MKEKIYFSQFYRSVREEAMGKLLEILTEKEHIITDTFYISVGQYLDQQLQFICMRTLIVEIHRYKDEKLLNGKNLREEYEFFCNEIVDKKIFINGLFRKYPELERCVKERITFTIEYILEILSHFQQDQAKIMEKICKKDGHRIVGIKGGFSDCHLRGRQVVYIFLDNGEQILYKPHSLKNEEIFAEVLQWVSAKTGEKQKKIRILSRKDYGWSEYIEQRECQSLREVKLFYCRLGIQLCVAYILGTNDLHCENLVAFGEYPVLVDLETISHNFSDIENMTISDRICEQYRDSVLHTGLLPGYHWNQKGRGIDESGISGNEGDVLPFKIPIVVDPETSNIHLEYEYPTTKKAKNRVILQGKLIAPEKYIDELIQGFTKAYKVIQGNKELFFQKLFKQDFQTIKSRLLISDTQKYQMILSASYHPQLLSNRREREKFIETFFCGKSEFGIQISSSEISSILQGDIPLFEFALNGKQLITAQGEVINGYFKEKRIDAIRKKLFALSSKDLEKQINYIEMSYAVTNKSSELFVNRAYKVKNQKSCLKNSESREKIEMLIRHLIRDTVWNKNKTEVNWEQIRINLGDKVSWEIKLMNVYLYEGLSGMLILFYELMIKEIQDSKQIYQILRKMLFRYTDKGLEKIDNLYSKKTGMYEGESSLVYTYLLLFKKSGEKEYLNYAEKHAIIVEKLLSFDVFYDLLNGNAGAVAVMISLYHITNKKKYLEIAKRAAESLMKAAVYQEKGVGWITQKSAFPMAGLAHGNSGFLAVFLALWKETEDRKYEKFADNIWRYEESLYNTDINNWRDVRVGSAGKDDLDSVAWCHGVGGVLLSRVFSYHIVSSDRWKERLKTDIQRAYRKLIKYWQRDSWSLCHGICGNLWILEIVEAKMVVENVNRRTRTIPSLIKLPIQEKMNPGFMNGYGGIIYYFLCANRCEQK